MNQSHILVNFLEVDPRNLVLGFKNNQGVDFKTTLQTLYGSLKMIWVSGNLPFAAPFPMRKTESGYALLYDWVIDPILLNMLDDKDKLVEIKN